MKEGLETNMIVTGLVFGTLLIYSDWKISIEFYIEYNALHELIRINISKNLEYTMYGNRN